MRGNATVGGTSAELCTFRSHSWIVRLAAAGITVMLISRVLTASPDSSSGTRWTVIALLLGLGLLIPVVLLAWDHQRGIHVREDGIRSVGANGSRFLPWSEIAGFEIGAHIGGTIAVFASRGDGTRVVLGDNARWPYQRTAVEHVRDKLVDYQRLQGHS